MCCMKSPFAGCVKCRTNLQCLLRAIGVLVVTRDHRGSFTVTHNADDIIAANSFTK